MLLVTGQALFSRLRTSVFFLFKDKCFWARINVFGLGYVF